MDGCVGCVEMEVVRSECSNPEGGVFCPSVGQELLSNFSEVGENMDVSSILKNYLKLIRMKQTMDWEIKIL